MAPSLYRLTRSGLGKLRRVRISLTAPFRGLRHTPTRPGPAAGQIVIADNLSSHKSTRALDLLRAQGNDLIFLSPYSPDLNPIEIIRAFSRTNGVHALKFAKLKTLIRKAAARTYQALWKKVGAVCDLFQPQESQNYFTAAGYGAH